MVSFFCVKFWLSHGVAFGKNFMVIMVVVGLKAVAGFKLHWVDEFYATFGVLGRAFKVVALAISWRNEGLGEIKIKTH